MRGGLVSLGGEDVTVHGHILGLLDAETVRILGHSDNLGGNGVLDLGKLEAVLASDLTGSGEVTGLGLDAGGVGNLSEGEGSVGVLEGVEDGEAIGVGGVSLVVSHDDFFLSLIYMVRRGLVSSFPLHIYYRPFVGLLQGEVLGKLDFFLFVLFPFFLSLTYISYAILR